MNITAKLLPRALKQQDHEILASLFAIDSRSLTAVRIGLGSLLLYDSITNFSFSGAGASLVEFAALLILPFACALLIGFKTRISAVLCWLIYGLPIRQGLLEPGVGASAGRYILVLFLFWATFLPLDTHLSVDKKSESRRPRRILSIASAAALIQLFLIYFSAGINKNFQEWLFDASAMKALLASGYGNDLGRLAAEADSIMAILSVVTIVLEIFGSLLLFVPGRKLETRRLVLVGAFISFHIGMATFMNLRMFPFVMITIWLLFLPSKVWDKLTGVPSEHSRIDFDRSAIRNLTAGLALVYVLVSNYITWAYFPADSGFAAQWQQVGIVLLLYQQWAMFSVPSSLV